MQPKPTRIEIIAITTILLLAAWMRFGYVGVNSFAFDEARLSLISLRMVRGGEFATVGMPSSAGVPNMPAAAWVFSLPYAISTNPQVASWFVSLLSLLAVYGVWWLARKWSTRAGLVAALFLALNPFAILYGRSIWAQNLLIPLTVLWMVAVFVSAQDGMKRRFAVGVAVFLTGFAGQVHFAGATLVLAGGYSFFRWRWWRYPLAVGIGAGFAVLCALPFVLTPNAVEELFGTASGASQIDLNAWQESVRLILGRQWSYLLHGEAELPLVRATRGVIMGGISALLAVLVSLLAVFGAAAIIGIDGELLSNEIDIAKDTSRISSASHLFEIMLIVLISVPLSFTWHSTPVFIHYLLPVIPAFGLMLGWLTQRKQLPAVRNIVTATVLVTTLGWFGQIIRAFPYAAETQTPNGIATPLRTLQSAANSIDGDVPVLYFTHGDDPDIQGEPAIFSTLWWEDQNTTRILDGRSILILPSYPATIMFTERPFQAWEEMRQSKLFADLREIPRREGVEPWQITPYDGETMPAGFKMLDEPVAFAHGGTLLGWRAYTIGGRVRVSTLWRAAVAIGEQVQQFHHLRTNETMTGEPFTGVDVSVRGHTWHEGDLVIVMGDFLNLPDNQTYTIEIGHYTLPDVTRISHATGDVVRLGEININELPPALE